MILYKQKNKFGFTIVELLVYVSLLSLIMLVVLSFGQDIIFGKVKNDAILEVNQNTQFVLGKISKIIKEAEAINSPRISKSANFLSLALNDPLRNPTIFYLEGDKVKMQEGINAPMELTSNFVRVTNLNFSNISYIDTHGTVKIDLSIENNNPNNISAYSAQTNFTATVSLW